LGFKRGTALWFGTRSCGTDSGTHPGSELSGTGCDTPSSSSAETFYASSCDASSARHHRSIRLGDGMTMGRNLEQALAEIFTVERRLPCPSGLHRRFAVRRKQSPEAGLLLLSCSQYQGPLTQEALVSQREIVARLTAFPCPSIQPLIEAVIEPQYHWMVSTLPELGTLHEHLREHRKLPVEEVEWLMRVLAGVLTTTVAKSWPRITLDPHQITLDLHRRQVQVLLPDLPIFGVSSVLEVDPLQTIAFNPAALTASQSQVPTSTRDYVTPLALLCCELLGEQEAGGPGGNEKFRPLAALSAQQNCVLRAALVGSDRHGFESVGHFVSELTGIESAEMPSVEHRATRQAQPPPLPSAPLSEVEMPGPLAAYTLSEEVRRVGPCSVWNATHPTLGEVVISSVDLSSEVAEVARRLQSLMHTLRSADTKFLIVPVDTPADARSLYVVRQRPKFRLLDALRQSRALEKPAVAKLLASIHGIYESLWALIGRRMVAMSLDQFWVEDDGNGKLAGLSGLRLDVAQVLLDHEFQPQQAMRPVEHFARLTLLLLGHDGGALAGGPVLRFAPIPELDAGANELLRNALDATSSGEVSLNSFLARISAALAGHTAMSQLRQKRTLKIPAKFSSRVPQALDRVRLMPDTKEAPILAVAVSGEVLIGRGVGQADLVTQFAPRSPLNDSRTRSVSRVQVRALMKGGQIMLEDIAGANPSMIDRQRLDTATAVDLPVTVLLGSEYPMELRSARSAHPPGGLAVEGWSETKKRQPSQRGATLLLPATAGVLKMELAWLHSDVGLVASRNGGSIRYGAADDPTCVARLHHHDSTLWIEVVSGQTEVKIGDETLLQGELSALLPGDVLTLGDRKLLVQPFHPEPIGAGLG